MNGETPAEDERAVQHVSIGRPIDLAVRVKPVIFKAEAMASSTLLDGVEKSLTGQAEKPIAERAQVDPASNEAIHLRDINKKLAAKIDSLEASLELYKARNKALEGKVMRQERQIHQNNVDISDMTSTIHDLVMSEGGAARI